ncbi:hypothetical protein [Streptodolium elevatio]
MPPGNGHPGAHPGVELAGTGARFGSLVWPLGTAAALLLIGIACMSVRRTARKDRNGS